MQANIIYNNNKYGECVCRDKQKPNLKWKWRRHRPKSDEFNSMKIGLPNRLHSVSFPPFHAYLWWVRAILQMLLHDKLYEIWELWYDWVDRMKRKDRTGQMWIFSVVLFSPFLCVIYLNSIFCGRCANTNKHTHTERNPWIIEKPFLFLSASAFKLELRPMSLGKSFFKNSQKNKQNKTKQIKILSRAYFYSLSIGMNKPSWQMKRMCRHINSNENHWPI